MRQGTLVAQGERVAQILGPNFRIGLFTVCFFAFSSPTALDMAEDHTLDLVEEEIRRAEALLARDLISNDERRFIIPCLSESTKAILTLCCWLPLLRGYLFYLRGIPAGPCTNMPPSRAACRPMSLYVCVFGSVVPVLSVHAALHLPLPLPSHVADFSECPVRTCCHAPLGVTQPTHNTAYWTHGIAANKRSSPTNRPLYALHSIRPPS